MRINKKNNYTYTKELDKVEKNLLNIFRRFLENDNSFLESSVDAIITEAVRRAKKEILKNDKRKLVNTCTSTNLPQNPDIGEGPYFDIDSGKPIWFNGSVWVFADGSKAYENGGDK